MLSEAKHLAVQPETLRFAQGDTVTDVVGDKLTRRLIAVATGPAPALALALFVALPLLAFPEIVFGGQTLYRDDISGIHYPYHIFAASEWLAGRVPLWNPYNFLGIPALAECQVGVLYPGSLLFLSPLPASLNLSLFILLHFTLAAVFTCALARCLGLGWPAATLAGLSFGMGGVLMAQVTNVDIMSSAAWFPMILCAAILVAQRRRWPFAILTGIPLAMQILSGHPQIVFYTLVTVAGYGLYRVVADLWVRRGPAGRGGRWAIITVLLLAVMVTSGLALAAPQLLMTYEMQQFSVRSQEQGAELLVKDSLPPAMTLNLVLPGAFGNNVVGFRGGDPFEEEFVYAGFIPLVLAFFCWGQRRKKDMPFFVLLLFGAAVMAFGSFTPLYDYVIRYLPGFSLFRIPARWLMGVNLALAVLAAYGLETALEKGLSRARLGAVLLAGLLLVGGLVFLRFFGTQLLAGLTRAYDRRLLAALLDRVFSVDPVYGDRLLLSWVVGLSAPGYLLAANVAATSILFGLFAAPRISARLFSGLIIAAVSIDLAVAGGTTVNPVTTADWWQQLSGGAGYVLQHLSNDTRVFPLGMGSDTAAAHKLGKYTPAAYRVRSAGGYGTPLMAARYDTFLHESDPVQMVQVLGVRYVLTEGRMGSDAEATYPPVYSDDTSVVYENRHPLPRAFVVHDAILAANPDEALAYFQKRDIDPRRTVILEAEAGESPPAVSDEGAGTPATIVTEDPQSIEISARLDGAGYLVLLDTFYPGWLATVDGQPAPIYRADYVARAVYVPAGEHRVRFEYQPMSFRLGAYLALATLGIMGVAGIGAAQRKSGVPDPPQEMPHAKTQRRKVPHTGHKGVRNLASLRLCVRFSCLAVSGSLVEAPTKRSA